jgi:hypothetical protein
VTRFISDFKRSLLGTSLESAEVPAVPAEPVHEGSVTQEDIDSVQEHRAAVIDVVEDLKALNVDSGTISDVTNAIRTVSTPLENADKLTPGNAQTYIGLSNIGADAAEKVLDTSIPRLQEAGNGITGESMEGVASWVASATKSVWAAAGKFFERIATGFARMNTTSQGFHNRIARIQGKMKNRKGDGGKPLSMKARARALLIEGTGFVAGHNGGEELKKFSAVALGIVHELEQYMLKVDAAAKNELMGALINNFDRGETVVDSSEFATKIASLLSAQGGHLLGNAKYEIREERGRSRILNCILVESTPSAAEMVKHLDAPVSLPPADVVHLLSQIADVVTHQTTQLQHIIKSTDNSFKQLRGVIGSMTSQKFDEKGEEMVHGHDANIHRLIRLENTLVDELSDIAKAMTRHQTDLIVRIDAVLTLVEESVFQD